MQIDFLNIATITGAAQGILLAAFLCLKRGRVLINLPLVIYILLMSANLINTLLIGKDILFSLFGFAYITELCNLSYGLLIYLYTRNKIAGRMVLKKSDLWFITPFILYFIYYLSFYKSGSYSATEYLKQGIEFSEHMGEWGFELTINIGFLIASLHTLRTYHRQIKQNYSTLEKINFTTTCNLVSICMAAYLIEVVLILLLMAGIPGVGFYHHIIYGLFVLALFVFGYNELIYPNVAVVPVIKEVKYKGSTLSSDSSQRIADNLRIYMQEQKPFLNPEITLKNLAESVSEQPYILSQVINENFGQNYYEFINSYRIEEAKRILKDSAHKDYTLTAIGFEAGFNSKSAFYTAFKKITGVSPAKYS